THTGSWGTSSGTPNQFKDVGSGASGTIANNTSGHTHTSAGAADAPSFATATASPANTDTTTNDPLHVRIIFIKSDGSPTGIPVSGVTWFNGSTPSGF